MASRLFAWLFVQAQIKKSKLRSPVTREFPHKGPVTRKMFSFDDDDEKHLKKITEKLTPEYLFYAMSFGNNETASGISLPLHKIGKRIWRFETRSKFRSW